MNKAAAQPTQPTTKLFIKGAKFTYDESDNGIVIEVPGISRVYLDLPADGLRLVNPDTGERREMTKEEMIVFEIGLDRITESFLGLALAKLVEVR